MSTIDRHIPNRRVAARNAADRRRKLLLVGLVALLAGVLAFQLPKLLHSSGSSSSTASPSVTAPATSSPAASAGGSVKGTGTSAPAKGGRAIGQMTSHDPFVPVTGATASASASSSSASSSSTSTAPASASASQPTSHSTAVTVVPTDSAPSSPAVAPMASAHTSPAVAPTASAHTSPAVAPTASAHTSPAATRPAVASPAAPTAAVIWTNGTRHVVDVGHTFDIGDATFKLAAVDGPTMRLQVPDGSFTGGKRTITIRKGREVILENNATGVLYTLRFAGGTSNGS